MGIFEHFPYTNFHEMNLDWILHEIKTLESTIEQFVSINALKYADPIQWNIVNQYEKNTIVIDPLSGTAYISVQPVPSGVALTNTDYWTIVFDLGGFIVRAAKNFTNRYEDATTLTATFPSTAGNWLVWGDVLYKALVNITAGDQYVVNSNIEHFTMEDIIGHLDDLNTTDKSNLVAAINEVLLTLQNTAGDLNDLNTTDKSNLVNAINEVLLIIGDLNNLNTADKSSLVAAINEVNTKETYAPINSGNLIYTDPNTGKSTKVQYAIIDKAYKPRLVMAGDTLKDANNDFIVADAGEIALREKATIAITASTVHSSYTTSGTVIIDGDVKHINDVDYAEWAAYDLENLYMTSDGKLHVVDTFETLANMLLLNPVWSFNGWQAIYKEGAIVSGIRDSYLYPQDVIAQDFDGNYLVLTSEGRQLHNNGLDYAGVVDVIKNVIGFNADIIYGCDGGGSAALIEHQVRQNGLLLNEVRKVPTMIVFDIDNANTYSDYQSGYSEYQADIQNKMLIDTFNILDKNSRITIVGRDSETIGIECYDSTSNGDSYDYTRTMKLAYDATSSSVFIDALNANDVYHNVMKLDEVANSAKLIGKEVVRGDISEYSGTITTNANGVIDSNNIVSGGIPYTAKIIEAMNPDLGKVLIPYIYGGRYWFCVRDYDSWNKEASATFNARITYIQNMKVTSV